MGCLRPSRRLRRAPARHSLNANPQILLSSLPPAITLSRFAYFTTAGNEGVRQLKDDGDCPTVLKDDNGEDLEIGAPIPSDQYPKSYWDERNK